MQDMVKYIDRRGTDSLKWDRLTDHFGSDDLLSMWVADMDFRCPDCVNDALADYVQKGVYGYVDLEPRFVKAFVQWEKDVHGYEVKPEWVRFAPGVVPGVFWSISAMTQEGDAVMVMPPVYYPFFFAVEDLKRTLVESTLVWKNGRYEMDFEDIEDKIVSSDVKMLVFCSPHNPAGRVWTKEELQKLLDICQRHHVLIISDEIHQDIIMSQYHQIPFGTMTDREMITLTSPSKTFNLAGLKNAVAVIPDQKLREKWDAYVKLINERGANSLGYIAGEAAYLKGREWNKAVCAIVESNFIYLRDRLMEKLPKLRIPELEGTYLMWVDLGAYVPKEELEHFIEKKCRLALDYGEWFRGGADTWVRFNLATERRLIEEAADRILAALGNR